MGKAAECLGEARPRATVADDEVGGALEQLWGEAAVNTWNARWAAVLPAWAKRLPPPDSETPARSKMAVARLIARRDVHLREKTLWRMLDETVARSEEIIGVNIEELDLAGRRAPVKAKGAQPRTRRRGPPREEFVLETVYWDAGTARLLPRLIKGRTRGPVFVTHRKQGPGKVVATRRLPRRRPGPAVVRTGPRPTGCAHGHWRCAGDRLGPSRVPALRPHPSR